MKKLITILSICLSVTGFSQSFTVDQQMGGEAAAQIAATVGIYNDSNLTKYVNAIGQRLVNNLGDQPFTYEFHILDMAEPNAFALPGGYVYVSRGILALTNSEHELAGILGHEIIHVHRRHSIQQVRKGVMPGLLQLPGLFVGAVVDEQLGALINAPAALGSGLLSGKYSREHETEADEMGAALAAKSGYKPSSLSKILDNLHHEVEAITGEEESFSYFDSHPYTPNRVENLNKLVEKDKFEFDGSKKPFLNISDYKALIDGLPLEDNPSNGLVAEHVFYHKELSLKFNLGQDWVWNNTPMALQAVKEDGTLNFIVRVVGDSVHPKEAGHTKRDELFRKYGLKAKQSQIVELDGRPGYLLVYEEQMQEKAIKAYGFWWSTPSNDLVLITGIGTPESADEIWNSITSVSSISESELAAITYPTLSFIEANENETLSDVVNRAESNTLGMSLLSAMNGEPFEHTYRKGDLVKVGAQSSLKE